LKSREADFLDPRAEPQSSSRACHHRPIHTFKQALSTPTDIWQQSSCLQRHPSRTMEAYPLHYTAHNLPLILLSGLCPTPEGAGDLDTPRGPLVKAQLPLVQSERREQILQEFLSAEGSDQQWSSRSTRSRNGQTPLVGYKFRAVGRVSRHHEPG
jgi:hypothetical protein